MVRHQRVDEADSVGCIECCHLVDLSEHTDPRGSLSVIESGQDVPFEIRRAYYLYDMPISTVRGAHGHRTLRQLVIAVYGRFEVLVDDGFRQRTFMLDRPSRGLFIGPMVWRNLVNLTPHAVGLVLASEHYDEADYYRDYVDFAYDARKLGRDLGR